MSIPTEEAETAAATVTCGTCGLSVLKPPPARWAPLWDAGWRWLGTRGLFSCPGCPPVLVVDPEGRHIRPQAPDGGQG
ncbi:hypothetical protein AB0F20_10030 [Streptomyces goshikiensis]|uniref:hypothetical protein n=1 Tax=Streptomyces goshikiensis TaxID=1942 RepID=UPI0033E818DC